MYKKGSFIFRFMTITLIVASVMSIIIARKIKTNGSTVDSVWTLILYAIGISIGLFIVNHLFWLYLKFRIANKAKTESLKNNQSAIENAKLSIDRKDSVYYEIDNDTLGRIWEGEDSDTIKHWNYDERKQNAYEKIYEIHKSAESKGKSESNEFGNKPIIANIIYSVMCCVISTCLLGLIIDSPNLTVFTTVVTVLSGFILIGIVAIIIYINTIFIDD